MLIIDHTGSLQAINAHNGAKPKKQRMSYEYRAGQVGRLLNTHPSLTIYDLARLLEMSPRQMHNICDRMAREGRVSVRQVPHHNTFKHLISRSE